MFEIFRTLLLSGALGTAVILLLLALKPLTVKRLPAQWQYYMWLIAAICMIVPFWRAVPQPKAQRIIPDTAQTSRIQPTQPQAQATQPPRNQAPVILPDNIPAKYREIRLGLTKRLRIYDLIAYIWAAGAGIFLTAAIGNYCVFLFRKRRSCIELKHTAAFEDSKKELGVKRRIKVRVSGDISSPMLAGTFFPVIYIPQNGMDSKAEKMIFLHELTHYKHGDLIYKWLVLVVNALHWFNPFAYLLSANVSQSCEVYCDMSVVENMDEENKTVYMKTILLLAEKGGRKNV